MIDSLQSLRGIFAIFIFLHHIQYKGESMFISGGPCGVAFFFILSGFVMCAGWENKIDNGAESKTRLFLRRIIRVYPLHLLCMSIVILLGIKSISIVSLVKLIPNFLLLQSWFPIQSIYFSGNALSWCLCDLMFFYLLFPCLIKLLEYRRRIAFIIFVIIAMLFIGGIICIPNEKAHSLLYINPAFRLIDFIIGICLWQVWVKIRNDKRIKEFLPSIKKCTVNLIEFSSVFLVIISLSLSQHFVKF